MRRSLVAFLSVDMESLISPAISPSLLKLTHWHRPSASVGALMLPRHFVPTPCRIPHSLLTCSPRAVVFLPRRCPRRWAGPIMMEEATATTSNVAAGSSVFVNKEEGGISTGSGDVTKHVEVLKTAAKTRSVPPTEVFAAIRAIEKMKVDPSIFLQYLGGTQSPGRTWMLVFTVGSKVVRDALNGGPGGGQYLPVSAVQNFDAAAMRIENGVYLGPLGALAFEGRFSMKKRILAFLYDNLKIKIGSLPHFTIRIGKKEDEGREPGNTDPFFIWFYADDEIIVAKGRGGGLAFWCRCRRVAK